MPGPANPAAPKKKSASSPKVRGATRKGKESPKRTDFAALKKSKANLVKSNLRSDNTNKNYKGYIQRGRLFVQTFQQEEQEAEDQWQTNGGDRMSGDGEEIAQDGGMDPNFCKAFDGPPLGCTPLAISMFMTAKCFEEGLKAQTAVSIDSAFKDHYKTM